MRGIKRMLAVAGKEVRQLARDRLTGGMVVGIPLIMILLFGYAINMDVRHLRLGIADQADTQRSRMLVADIQATQIVDAITMARDGAELEELLRRGDIVVGLLLPADFERRLTDPTRNAGQLMIDGADPIVQGVAQALANMPFAARPPQPAAASLLAVRTFYNPEGRSAVQVVPGLIGLILSFTMVLFTAVAIVRERERGNLEMLITTPIRTIELMAGKVMPYILIGLLQVTLILVVGIWLFDVPLVGSILDLYIAASAFIAATLSIGLLISTFAQTQFQAMQMTFFVIMPSILLSGFVFPFDGMPVAAQIAAQILPLTHFLLLVRGIVLKGAELGELLAPMRNLGIMFAIAMTISILRFRKRLD